MPAGPTPRPARAASTTRLTIGKVIARLSPEFPDLSVSKVRFLEAEGLLTPTRTGSGYRTYSDRDVERLRYILAAQRDHFWPLRVIREALETLDRGESTATPVPPPRPLRLTADDLADAADADASLVASLVDMGVLGGDVSGRFTAEDLQILEAVVWLQQFGLEPRHLRPFKATADREVGLIEQMLAPSGRGGRQARAGQIARHLQTIHAALVSKGLGGVLSTGQEGSTVEG
ncbi:MerR family transcriptional regulator [Nostocoides sp. F2B08]|uniref:transcriptional regulator FtsR n=1 Tax=Nostocoides sp. F2B08 TaxID=2653936 RepID=UPI001263B7D7|nr:MerR family transcriptional regulator [Tetrasphaera sp. F2B08]KAB7743015.1 MerR family transcriptional regulator [Tetrasphaera sp. F2B08]